MLSLVKGEPIAKISKGDLDGQIIRIYNPEPDSKVDHFLKFGLKVENDCTLRDMIMADCKEVCKLEQDFRDLLLEDRKTFDKTVSMLKKSGTKDKMLTNVVVLRSKIDEQVDEKLKSEIYCVESRFNQIINIDKHQTFACFGPSGSGKSYYIGKMLEEFREYEKEHKLKPKDIFIFSRVDKDSSFDEEKLKPVFRIQTSGQKNEEAIIDNIPEPHMFNDSLVIFDDITTISNKRVRDIVKCLSDKILETGRHHSITGFWTNHIIRDKNNTKHIHNEATSLTFFPQSNFNAVEAYFKDIQGFTKRDIEKLKRISENSRWITLLKSYPNMVLYENGGYLV